MSLSVALVASSSGLTEQQIASVLPELGNVTRVSPTTFSATVVNSLAESQGIITTRTVQIAATTLRIFVDPTPARASLQEQQSSAIAAAKVFVVGAGGIGCELLKDLFLAGWRDIECIDLDTIDATNLNRQFLFRPEDVGKPKSAVAAQRVLTWAAQQQQQQQQQGQQPLSIKAHHGNVKDPSFSTEWISQFSVVINGLDNVSARKHVNRLCIEANVPLVESGTMGYNGQAQPIVRGRYACYDCQPKSAEQKTFAVCTIHSRPTTIVHCIHYARELYARLFGDAVTGGASEFDFLNDISSSSSGGGGDSAGAANDDNDYAEQLATMLFFTKIKQLIELRDAKNTTATATTTTSDAASTATTTATETPPTASSSSSSNGPQPINVAEFLPAIRSKQLNAPAENEANPAVGPLLAQLFDAVARCRARNRTPFDKNDDTSVLFISAVTNLRATVFGIARKSAFEIRTIAGNIVPAIASTNAAVAAAAVHLATQLVLETKNVNGGGGGGGATGSSFVAMRQFPTRRKRVLLPSSTTFATAVTGDNNSSKKPKEATVWEHLAVSSFPPGAPNPNCIVCRQSKQNILQVRLHAGQHTLGDFVKKFLMLEMSLVSPCVHTATGTVYEHEDYETRSGDPMTKFVSPTNPRFRFEVDDLNQSIEWTVDVVHDESVPADTPFLHTVVSSAPVSGGAVATTSSLLGDAAATATSESKKTNNDDDDDDEVIFYHPKKYNHHQHQQQADASSSSQQQQQEGKIRQREGDAEESSRQQNNIKKPPSDVETIEID